MKKYRFIDEDGEKFEVEEIEDKTGCSDEETDPAPAHDETPVLTEDELAILRKLLPVADKLIALVAENAEPAAEDAEEEIDEEIEEENDEEVIDTDPEEKKVAHDSKKSVGAIAKVNNKDADIELTDEVSNAWAKRYGGK